VLDLGCGTARFLHGLVAARQSPKSYVGIDVQADQIAWCRKTLAPLGAFQFHHINVKNDRYNPSGTDTIEGRVPFPNAEADFIMLRSVLTHMRTQEAERTLKELRRCLAPGGRLYATANVAHGAPIWTDLPNDRGVTSTLLKVQFNKDSGHFGCVMARRTKRLWTDEEKRSICFQTTAPGVSVARVAQRYAMNANLIFKWLRDPRYAPEPRASVVVHHGFTPRSRAARPAGLRDRRSGARPAGPEGSRGR
jgi:SAM-dependent methyltransferase